MPILIVVVLALGGALWWWIRSNPRDALSLADDALTVVRNAPRRIAFRRQTKEHAVEGIDDPRLAIATIAHAFIALDDLPTRDQRDALKDALDRTWTLTSAESEEIDTLSRWLMDQCGGAQQTVARVARRLWKIDRDASWPTLATLMSEVVGDDLTASQTGAVEDLRIALHRR